MRPTWTNVSAIRVKTAEHATTWWTATAAVVRRSSLDAPAPRRTAAPITRVVTAGRATASADVLVVPASSALTAPLPAVTCWTARTVARVLAERASVRRVSSEHSAISFSVHS